METIKVTKEERYKLRKVLNNLKQKCNNPNHTCYKYYGARGIKVCKEWYDLNTFISWCKSNGYVIGLEIDRRDNDKNYEPSNCRIVDRKINMRNKGSNKLTQKDINNIRQSDKSIEELANEYNISFTHCHNIINYKKWN